MKSSFNLILQQQLNVYISICILSVSKRLQWYLNTGDRRPVDENKAIQNDIHFNTETQLALPSPDYYKMREGGGRSGWSVAEFSSELIWEPEVPGGKQADIEIFNY